MCVKILLLCLLMHFKGKSCDGYDALCRCVVCCIKPFMRRREQRFLIKIHILLPSFLAILIQSQETNDETESVDDDHEPDAFFWEKCNMNFGKGVALNNFS